MATTTITVTVTDDELAGLARFARRHRCDAETLAGLFIYRGLMDTITHRLDVGADADALRALSLGTSR